MAELIKIELGDLLSEEAKNSNLFKMIQVNSYCGKAGLGEFKFDTQLKIDEYLSKANLVRTFLLYFFTLIFTFNFNFYLTFYFTLDPIPDFNFDFNC